MAALKDNLKYFVGGIPSDAKQRDLYEFFKRFGVVKRVTSFNSDESKKLFGFCFVKFKSLYKPDVFDGAHRFHYQGRQIEINPIVRRSGLKQSIEEKHAKRIFIQNIPKEMTENQLYEIFRQFGEIINCFIITREEDMAAGEHKMCQSKPVGASHTNYGYVIFQDKESALKVVEKKHLTLMCGTRLFVKKYNSSITRNHQAFTNCGEAHSEEQHPYRSDAKVRDGGSDSTILPSDYCMGDDNTSLPTAGCSPQIKPDRRAVRAVPLLSTLKVAAQGVESVKKVSQVEMVEHDTRPTRSAYHVMRPTSGVVPKISNVRFNLSRF